MNLKILAIMNLIALGLLYFSFIPFSNYAARILILLVAIFLLVRIR